MYTFIGSFKGRWGQLASRCFVFQRLMTGARSVGENERYRCGKMASDSNGVSWDRLFAR